VLRMINSKADRQSKTLGDLTKEHTVIQTLKNKLDLQPTKDER
jgi:hypothetical protein